jgi:hypothetical protein
MNLGGEGEVGAIVVSGKHTTLVGSGSERAKSLKTHELRPARQETPPYIQSDFYVAGITDARILL